MDMSIAAIVIAGLCCAADLPMEHSTHNCPTYRKAAIPAIARNLGAIICGAIICDGGVI